MAVFWLSGGSSFEGPSHHFCGAGSIWEGSSDSIHRLTCSIGVGRKTTLSGNYCSVIGCGQYDYGLLDVGKG